MLWMHKQTYKFAIRTTFQVLTILRENILLAAAPWIISYNRTGNWLALITFSWIIIEQLNLITRDNDLCMQYFCN